MNVEREGTKQNKSEPNQTTKLTPVLLRRCRETVECTLCPTVRKQKCTNTKCGNRVREGAMRGEANPTAGTEADRTCKLDHPSRISCTAGGSQAALLAVQYRLPFVSFRVVMLSARLECTDTHTHTHVLGRLVTQFHLVEYGQIKRHYNSSWFVMFVCFR